MSATSIIDSSNTTVTIDKTEQEINKLYEAIRAERRKHSEYKILHELVFDCLRDNSGLDSDVQVKVHDILMSVELKQCMDLPNNNLLLGLAPFNQEDLSYTEREKLRQIVQKGLANKSRTIFQELKELGIDITETPVDNSAINLSMEDKVLLDRKTKLNEIQKVYVLKLQEMMEVLEKIVHLKTEVLPEATYKKISACEVMLDMYRLRAEVINTKLRVNIAIETNRSLDAYQAILKDIQQQQEECKQEIDKLQELKMKYQKTSSKEYSEILKSYLQYKNYIEKKKLLYKQLCGK